MSRQLRGRLGRVATSGCSPAPLGRLLAACRSVHLAQGKQLVFVTNNSTKSRAGYLKKFTGLGLNVKAVSPASWLTRCRTLQLGLLAAAKGSSRGWAWTSRRCAAHAPPGCFAGCRLRLHDAVSSSRGRA